MPRESLTSFFVSSISEPGVAVNLGGACGGFRYLAGAIIAVVSGRTEANVAEESFDGVRWPASDVRRVLMRPDARMRVMETKRKAAVRASLKSREDARVEEDEMGDGCRVGGYWKELRLVTAVNCVEKEVHGLQLHPSFGGPLRLYRRSSDNELESRASAFRISRFLPEERQTTITIENNKNIVAAPRPRSLER